MTQTDAATAPNDAPVGPRPWWRSLPVILLLGVAPVPFGLYFVGFIGIALLLSDRTRGDAVRAAGLVLILWWMYMWRQGATSPWLSAVLLLIAAVLLGRAALRARAESARVAAYLPGALAVAAVVTAVLGIVPDGYRPARISSTEAVADVLSARDGRREMTPHLYLVDSGRARFVHTPMWFVVLYERHPDVDRTADGQPCLRRREVWQVDALDGAVSLATHDDATVVDDPCLPLRIGTERDLKPVPSG